MSHLVEVFATQSYDLSWMPGTHTMTERTGYANRTLTFTLMPWHACAHAHLCAHTH